MDTLQVAIGVITKDERFFVTRRKAHQHQGNKWEFPGGKVELDESTQQALVRELKEEVGISVNTATYLTDITFTYPEKRVCLSVHLVDDFSGDATGNEGQDAKWVSLDELLSLDFPQANTPILDELRERFS